MAKRFTDTAKWKRPWFRALGLHAKIVWQYLCDECDHAGIWLADFELISFQVGFKVDEEKLNNWLGDKLVKLDHDKYFIPSFFEFQYKGAKDGFKAKVSAIDELSKYGLIEESTNSLVDLTNSYLSVQGVSMDSPSKSIGIGKSKGNKGGVGEKYTPEFEAAWSEYPRKDDKGDAFRAYQANVKADEHANVLTAIQAYKSKLARDGTDAKYIKLGATFFNKRRWLDCLDPNYGQAEDFSSKTPSNVDFSRYKDGETV